MWHQMRHRHDYSEAVTRYINECVSGARLTTNLERTPIKQLRSTANTIQRWTRLEFARTLATRDR